jgi:hypothetical protein
MLHSIGALRALMIRVDRISPYNFMGERYA